MHPSGDVSTKTRTIQKHLTDGIVLVFTGFTGWVRTVDAFFG